MYVDSSAALAIARRKGAGKMRHINVNSLWIQERQNEKDLELRKVLGTENPADLMTKNLARQALDKCMLQLNQHRTVGRAQTSLNIQGKGKTNVNTGSIPSEEPVVAGRMSENRKSSDADVSTESDATDPEMPALVPLALPANRSARAALARLNAKPKDKPLVASKRDRCITSRLGSLRVCDVEPSVAPCSNQEALQLVSLRAEDEPDWPIIFQTGRQGHKRLAQARRESTCPVIDQPGRITKVGSGVRGTRTLAGL